MGLPVRWQDAGEVQEEPGDELDTDWYQFYCQAIASGVEPDRFGDLTYSQIMATIDAAKLRSYNDRYFDVVNIVAEMDDEGVRKALYSKGGGNPSRSKLIENMMRPYSPSFLLPEVSQVIRARPIEGMDPRVAEGIMQAVERRVVPHMQWLAIHKVWERILATSRQWRPEAQAK